MPHRKKIIAGNWKMNKTATEAKPIVQDILLELKDYDACDVVLCPPFTALSAVSEALSRVQNIRLGAQNLHQAASGAYTGEISAGMLRDLYVRYVIIGHSERRQYFAETNDIIRQKIKTAIDGSLKPIACIGETLTEREENRWQEVLTMQLKEGFAGFTEKDMAEIVLAYEPVWAIGTGRTATPAQAQETHAFIRHQILDLFGQHTADHIRIQYGGSVKADNAKELLNQPDIDGALVGGASLEARSFVAIIKNACGT
ncbi:MAG: triose-phosphate isomerase [Candidatus Methylacidiphilales bacterium]|nr:triose-phosphate isomerase [Candidatus Methylacidiphilales bacterium]